MDRLQMPRRLSTTLASLALIALPIGCGSETKTTVEVPAPPAVVADAPVPSIEIGATTITPTTPTAEAPGTLDQHVYQTAGEIKGEANRDAAEARKEAREAEGDVKKAVGDAEGEAKQKARELEAEARKSAEDALDKLLPSPK